MSRMATDFLQALLVTFQLEAEEHLKLIVSGLLALEKTMAPAEQLPILEVIFREAHSLKGAARAVNLTDIEVVCQSLEGVFARLKRREIKLSSAEFDILRQALNTVEALLHTPDEPHAARVAEIVQRLVCLEVEGLADDVTEEPNWGAEPSLLGPSASSVSPEPFQQISPPSSEELPAQPTFPAEPPLQPEASSPLSAVSPGTQTLDFLTTLLATFRLEADEHLKAITSGLLDLEKAVTPDDQLPILEAIFREAHSLKGAARAVNQMEVEAICQSLEEVFARLKRRELQLTPEGFDLIHKAANTMEALLHSPDEPHATQVAEAIQGLVQLETQEDLTSETPEQFEKIDRSTERSTISPFTAEGPRSDAAMGQGRSMSLETIRVSTAKLGSLLLQAEEMIGAKLAASHHATELHETFTFLVQWKKAWAKISSEIRKVQQHNRSLVEQHGQDRTLSQLVVRLAEFLDWHEPQLSLLEHKLATLTQSVEHNQQTIGTMVDNLVEDTKKVLMLPFSSLLESFPRMVRDLSRTLGKETELVVRGGEIEIDRRILEELKDPLIHLLRNAIDHGIESPEVRAQQGKPGRGTLLIAISQLSGNTVEMLVSDDGAGIDHMKVKAAALKRGVLSPEEAAALDQQAALALIFQSDVSTSPIVTDISGRGLGMAIVREKVEKLGGQISVETVLHEGTSFRILLPLTLATFRGIFVQVGDRLFVIPTANVERVVRLQPEEIRTVENKETIVVNQRSVALARLDDVLGLPRKAHHDIKAGFVLAVVLGAGEKRIAFCIDEVLNEQEVLFKRLGNYLSSLRNVAGATVIGSGTVVPILHVPDLLESAVNGTAPTARMETTTVDEDSHNKSILLVEDSVTSRMLLKGILESAGYQVVTAVDGQDAFTALKKTAFDLVVSDIEMPRINGFELTTKIRTDEQHARLPVVLVTGLESAKDRERGISVGADAYIVKSSFDRSNLLAVVQRLI
jgi:two-component system chemotaxis sensor kinase CheA